MFDAPTFNNGGAIFLVVAVLIALFLLGSLGGKFLKERSGSDDSEGSS